MNDKNAGRENGMPISLLCPFFPLASPVSAVYQTQQDCRSDGSHRQYRYKRICEEEHFRDLSRWDPIRKVGHSLAGERPLVPLRHVGMRLGGAFVRPKHALRELVVVFPEPDRLDFTIPFRPF